jgi:hypothetical protein
MLFAQHATTMFIRISSAMFVRESRTNSAKGALGRHDDNFWVVGPGDVPCWAGSNTYAGCG